MKFQKKPVLIIIILIGIVILFSSNVSAADTTKVLVTSTQVDADSQSTNPSTSANGRYVAFESFATNLGPGSSGKGIQDIYVYDHQTNNTEWITHTPNGGAANGNSYTPSISGDGRYVTFTTTATNLGDGGSGNGIKDIYLYDRVLKKMKWITHSPTRGPASNHSSAPVISADGTTIAFQSTAKNLGTGGSEHYVSDIYVYDVTSDAPDNYPQWITHTVRGYTANGGSMNPTINENGRYTAFETIATNLGPFDFLHYGSGNGIKDIFCYDRVTETMEWITVIPPKITADKLGGTFNDPFNVILNMNQLGTIYWSYVKLGYGDAGWNVYVNPVLINTNTHLYFYGETLGGRLSDLTSENYIFPTVSGKPSVWASPSTGQYYNFVDVNLKMDLPGTIYYSINDSSYNAYTGTLTFVKNTVLRFYGITLEDVISDPGVEIYTIISAPLSIGGINPSISSDGLKIAYQSGNSIDIYREYMLSPNYTKVIVQTHDNIFVYNRLNGENRLITQTILGRAANGTSANPSISGDGNFVAFESTANNLGIDPDQPYGSNMPGVVFYDDSFRRDIFVYNLNTISLFYLNWITHSTIYGPANGNSYTPSLNEDGTVLAFSSPANNFGPGGNGVYRDIFLFDSGIQVLSNKKAGTYNSPITVNLTLINGPGTIYYTTDATDPKSSGTRRIYENPFLIDTTSILRYIADADGIWSPSYQQNYKINKPENVITIAQLNSAAAFVSNYYETNSKQLPSSVTINGVSYSMAQLLYLLTTATINMNTNNLNSITAKTVNGAPNPSGTIKSGNIVKANYISYAKSIQTFINTNGRAPNFISTTLGKMQFKYMVYMYSKVVNFHVSKNRLPNYVSLDASSSSNQQNPPQNPPTNVISIAQLNSAAAFVSNYYETNSKQLPSSVTINGVSYSMAQLLYLLTTATINMNTNNLNSITAKTVNGAPNPSGTIKSGNIVKANYISYAKSIQTFINTNGRAPNFISTTLGKMQFKYMVYMYSKVVNFYVSKNRLPNYVAISK
ncbi:MAG: hypothetical protein FGO69_11315 [Methanobacterium sp.]|nr:MAG: hypothetical protein FGO69_11315 [Methanobacterium sp.]